MAFICPPKEECDRKKDLLCNIKQIMAQLEEREREIPCKIFTPPCPSVCPGPNHGDQQKKQLPTPPEMMVCYRVKKPQTKATEPPNSGIKLKQSKSRELRGGILHVGCDCEKRNGLQDDCQRSECHGSPECLTKPHPICGPSEFSNGKHLGKKEYRITSDGSYAGNSGDNNSTNMEYQCYPAFLDTEDVCPALTCPMNY